MEERVRTLATTLLGGGLLVAGGVGAVRVSHTPDSGALPYYSVVSLLGGGAMVLIGLLLRAARPSFGTAVLVVGAVTGVVASMHIVVLPVLVLVVLVLTLRDQSRPHAHV